MINVELFPCSGGMAEGFRRAGITFDLAFDYSREACDSYEANLGHRPIQIDVRDLLRLARFADFSAGVRLLVADPPCTPWSWAGKRKGLEDERDVLRETCELISILRPQAYLIGNVPGLEMAPNQAAVHETIGKLSEHGYCVAEFITLNAADYGVPQFRVRPFWFGHLSGPHLRWPEPTHHDPALGLPLFGQTKPWRTCRDALDYLPLSGLGRPSRATHNPKEGEYALHKSGHAHPLSKPDEPAHVIVAGRERGARGGAVVHWPWDRPATTIQRDERLSAAGHHDPSNKGHSNQHGPNAIILSETARAILQGFPETWKFVGKTKQSRGDMIGQAMPPPLAEAVARSIAEQLRRTESEAA